MRKNVRKLLQLQLVLFAICYFPAATSGNKKNEAGVRAGRQADRRALSRQRKADGRESTFQPAAATAQQVNKKLLQNFAQ